MSWRLKDGKLSFEDDSTIVRITGRVEYKEELAKRFLLNPYFLTEWEKYRIKAKDKTRNKYLGKQDAKIFFGDHEAEYDEVGDYWSFVFKNYIGKSQIRMCVKNHYLPFLNVEVKSSKLTLDEKSELFYPEFSRRLVDSLWKWQLTLPFEITSPTLIAVEDVPIPPALPILFHQIIDNDKRIVESIQTILANPHKDLTTEQEQVNLYEIESVDADVCISIFHNPEQLIKAKSSDLSLCSKLKGFIPEKIMQFKNIETFDTPENRFVKQFIRELLLSMKRIEDLVLKEQYTKGLGEKLERWREIKGALETALLSGCFQEVDDLNAPSNQTSQVLLKREGYRELLQIHNKLLLSKSPIFAYLDEIIAERNIADMYEFWCFFELSRRLQAKDVFNGDFRIDIETALEGGLAQSKAKAILGDYELIYNKRFLRSRKGSYSVPLKPDFSLQKDNKTLLVLDAKFRFSVKDQELESSSAEDYQENAIGRLEVERIAKISDIFKMHTYRDALGAKSATILYPGNQNVFFSKLDYSKTKGNFEEIFRKICDFEEGVGYLAFVPSQTIGN
jgi:predicted component of viral defense system (DUF524 family)